jgi:hypothetical protein
LSAKLPFAAAQRTAEKTRQIESWMLLVGYCFGIRSERRLCEEVGATLNVRQEISRSAARSIVRLNPLKAADLAQRQAGDDVAA